MDAQLRRSLPDISLLTDEHGAPAEISTDQALTALPTASNFVRMTINPNLFQDDEREPELITLRSTVQGLRSMLQRSATPPTPHIAPPCFTQAQNNDNEANAPTPSTRTTTQKFIRSAAYSAGIGAVVTLCVAQYRQNNPLELPMKRFMGSDAFSSIVDIAGTAVGSTARATFGGPVDSALFIGKAVASIALIITIRNALSSFNGWVHRSCTVEKELLEKQFQDALRQSLTQTQEEMHRYSMDVNGAIQQLQKIMRQIRHEQQEGFHIITQAFDAIADKIESTPPAATNTTAQNPASIPTHTIANTFQQAAHELRDLDEKTEQQMTTTLDVVRPIQEPIILQPKALQKKASCSKWCC